MKKIIALALSLVVSGCAANKVNVGLLSRQFEFAAADPCDSSMLPNGLAAGFQIDMDVDFNAPCGDLMEIPGVLLLYKNERAVKAKLQLRQESGEIWSQQLALPFRFLPNPEGVHTISLRYTGAIFQAYVDGRLVDDDGSIGCPDGGGAVVASPAVDNIRIYTPAREAERVASKEDDSLKYNASNIQYWTPDFFNGWVGDVVSCYHKGRYHIFYLFDRRHHGGKFGRGGHWFEHLSTADFKTWTEHEAALPITDQWMTYGTGTAFTRNDSLLITYGFHTSRFYPLDKTTYQTIKDNADAKGFCEPLKASDLPELYPEGSTWAVSSDGLEPFKPSGVYFHYAENPSVFPDSDSSGLKMYANYMSTGTWTASDINGPWTCVDPDFPPGGDCTFSFTLGDWEYIVGGFHNMWYRRIGEDGEFKDMIPEAIDLYNGLSVPTFTVLPDGRCIMAGWTCNEGWGGNLAIYEVVQRPDGTLGSRWMKEITPAFPKARKFEGGALDRTKDFLLSFNAPADSVTTLRFFSKSLQGIVLEWTIDPKNSRASYVCYVLAGEKPEAQLIREGGHPEWMSTYAVRCDAKGSKASVRMILHNEAKMSGTLIDTEINRDRTMLDHINLFKIDSVEVIGPVENLKISEK